MIIKLEFVVTTNFFFSFFLDFYYFLTHHVQCMNEWNDFVLMSLFCNFLYKNETMLTSYSDPFFSPFVFVCVHVYLSDSFSHLCTHIHELCVMRQSDNEYIFLLLSLCVCSGNVIGRKRKKN